MRKIIKFLSSPSTWYVILFALILYFLKEILNFFGEKQDDYSTKLSVKGSTLSDDDCKILADKLHVSMGSIGTDEDVIFDVFEEVKTQSNYNKIHNIFGVRGYVDFLGSGTSIKSSLKLNLSQWLNSELSASDIDSIKQKYKIIF